MKPQLFVEQDRDRFFAGISATICYRGCQRIALDFPCRLCRGHPRLRQAPCGPRGYGDAPVTTMKAFRWVLRIAVIVFLVWMAIDLAPRLVPSLNSLSDNLQKTADGLAKTATGLKVYTEKARKDLAQENAALSATTKASPIVPPDLSRVEQFKRLPKLAEKKRPVWIKERQLTTLESYFRCLARSISGGKRWIGEVRSGL
jgi:hypothetical protein